MSSGLIGVAISTTGHEHRMRFLETCVANWRKVLPLGSVLVITVDGSEEDAARVRHALRDGYGMFLRVGQIDPGWGVGPVDGLIGQRLGVAANKNTGLEALMDAAGGQVEHLFLADDDVYPHYPESLNKHIDFGYAHSILMWGRSRYDAGSYGDYATWLWPRGVMLYQNRVVVETVGGMDERFGLGGHEHVEWSQRIHNAGLTPAPFISPVSYTTRSYRGAAALWAAVDMPKVGEARHTYFQRKDKHTTIHRTREEWDAIDKIMKDREGSSDFVPFQAHENGRASATLIQNIPSQGAEESK